MVIKFKNIYLEALAKDEIKGKPKYDSGIILKFKKTLKVLQYMPNTKSLRALNGLRFESLKGDRKGYFSVRVDYHYRLIFEISYDTIKIREIIIVNELANHYQ